MKKNNKQWKYTEKLEKIIGQELFPAYIGLHKLREPHWHATMYEKGQISYEIRLFLDKKSAKVAGFDKIITVSVVKLT